MEDRINKSILSSVSQTQTVLAVEPSNVESRERKNSDTLVSLLSVMKTIQTSTATNATEKSKTLGVMSSISNFFSSIKKKMFGDTQETADRSKQNEQKKIFSSILGVLENIEDKFSDVRNSTNPQKLFMIIGGILFGVFLKIKGIFVGAVKAIKLFLSPLSKLFSKLKIGEKFRKIFGLLSKLGNTKIGKGVVKTISTIVKVFSKVGKAIGKIGTFFTKTGGILGKVLGITKFMGPVMKAIPFVGWIFAAVTGIIDGIKGFFNADKIFDKKEGETTSWGEKISAVIGSILDGAVGFLLRWMGINIDVKNISKFINDKIITPITNLFTSIWSTLSGGTAVSDMLSNLWTKTKDFFSSIITSIKDMIVNVFDMIFKPSKEGGDSLFTTIKNSIVGFVGKIPEMITSLFTGEDSIVKKIIFGVFNMFKGILARSGTVLGSIFTSAIDFVQSKLSGSKDEKKVEQIKPKVEQPKQRIIEEENIVTDNDRLQFMSNFLMKEFAPHLAGLIAAGMGKDVAKSKEFKSLSDRIPLVRIG